jgi:hypothetical protein
MSMPTFGFKIIFIKSTIVSEKNGSKQNYSKRRHEVRNSYYRFIY